MNAEKLMRRLVRKRDVLIRDGQRNSGMTLGQIQGLQWAIDLIVDMKRREELMEVAA